MEDNLNRIQYVILNIMRKRKAVDHMHSMSCNEIREIENRCKVTTIYKHICILEQKGAKIERAFGYILTAKAIDMLPKEEMEENKDE